MNAQEGLQLSRKNVTVILEKYIHRRELELELGVFINGWSRGCMIYRGKALKR